MIVVSAQSHKSPLKLVHELLLWNQLLRTLIVYRVKNDKRHTVLGNAWHLLNPLLNMMIFVFVFQFIFEKEQENYALFFFCGMVFFRFITLCFSQGSMALRNEASLLKACYVPKSVVVVAAVLTNLYYMLIELVVLAILMVFFGVPPTVYTLLVVPLIAVVALGAIGLAFLVAGLGVRLPDLPNVIQHVNRLAFYFSPVMYNVEMVENRFLKEGHEELFVLYMLNPIASVMETARDIVVRGSINWGYFSYTVIFCFVLLTVGLFVFSRLERSLGKLL